MAFIVNPQIKCELWKLNNHNLIIYLFKGDLVQNN